MLTDLIARLHVVNNMDATGHSFDHTLQVAQCALVIAEDDYVGRLAGAAGLCHNADRILQQQLGDKKNVSRDEISRAVQMWLETTREVCDERDIMRIVQAVLHHSEVNQPNSDDVLITLQDADRITCSMADNVITSAQFWRELPAINPRQLTGDPTAHPYRDPKTVLNGLTCRYDWIDPSTKVCVRLPKAKTLMRRRADFIRHYIQEVKEQRAEIGLWPYELSY